MVASGADRVAANGDTANKIGTLSLAVNARRCGARHSLFPSPRFPCVQVCWWHPAPTARQ